MNVNVKGSRYIGLVSETCFAEIENKVAFVYIDSVKIMKLNQCVIPKLKNPVIFDSRYQYNALDFCKKGFEYYQISKL